MLFEMLKVLFVSVCVSDVPTIVPAGATCPLWSCALRFSVTVVLAIEKGAVPVDTVEIIGWVNVLLFVKVLAPARDGGRVTVNKYPVTPVAVMLTL